MQYARTEDLLDGKLPTNGNGRLDPSPLLGTWLNTNGASNGIVKLSLTVKDGALAVQAFGADDPTPTDWGEVKGEVYAKSVDSHEGTAFRAVYDFGFMAAHLQANVKQGVLVVANFAQFKDDSGRANYFVREFYSQA